MEDLQIICLCSSSTGFAWLYPFIAVAVGRDVKLGCLILALFISAFIIYVQYWFIRVS